MNFVAVKMLTGDRSKYVGLIFAISIASMLMAHQASIFGSIMWRTTSQIQDVRDAEIWVMDHSFASSTRSSLSPTTTSIACEAWRGSSGQCGSTKGTTRIKSPDGRMRAVVLRGMDDATLVGAPRKLKLGTLADMGVGGLSA